MYIANEQYGVRREVIMVRHMHISCLKASRTTATNVLFYPDRLVFETNVKFTFW